VLPCAAEGCKGMLTFCSVSKLGAFLCRTRLSSSSMRINTISFFYDVIFNHISYTLKTSSSQWQLHAMKQSGFYLNSNKSECKDKSVCMLLADS